MNVMIINTHRESFIHIVYIRLSWTKAFQRGNDLKYTLNNSSVLATSMIDSSENDKAQKSLKMICILFK